jgi:hypothetical protein
MPGQRAKKPAGAAPARVAVNAHVPDEKSRSQVRTMAGLGLPQHMMARILGIAENTLVDRYREDIDLGMAQATMQIAGKLFQKAQAGDMGAIQFWLRARAGWTTDRVEVAGKVEHQHGGSVTAEVVMSEHQRAAVLAVMKAQLADESFGGAGVGSAGAH